MCTVELDCTARRTIYTSYGLLHHYLKLTRNFLSDLRRQDYTQDWWPSASKVSQFLNFLNLQCGSKYQRPKIHIWKLVELVFPHWLSIKLRCCAWYHRWNQFNFYVKYTCASIWCIRGARDVLCMCNVETLVRFQMHIFDTIFWTTLPIKSKKI